MGRLNSLNLGLQRALQSQRRLRIFFIEQKSSKTQKLRVNWLHRRLSVTVQQEGYVEGNVACRYYEIQLRLCKLLKSARNYFNDHANAQSSQQLSTYATRPLLHNALEFLAFRLRENHLWVE